MRHPEPIAAADIALIAELTDPRERRHVAEAGLRARRLELALYAQLYAERNGDLLDPDRIARRDEVYSHLTILAGASS